MRPAGHGPRLAPAAHPGSPEPWSLCSTALSAWLCSLCHAPHPFPAHLLPPSNFRLMLRPSCPPHKSFHLRRDQKPLEALPPHLGSPSTHSSEVPTPVLALSRLKLAVQGAGAAAGSLAGAGRSGAAAVVAVQAEAQGGAHGPLRQVHAQRTAVVGHTGHQQGAGGALGQERGPRQCQEASASSWRAPPARHARPAHTSVWPAFEALRGLRPLPDVLPALGATQLRLQPLQLLGRISELLKDFSEENIQPGTWKDKKKGNIEKEDK